MSAALRTCAAAQVWRIIPLGAGFQKDAGGVAIVGSFGNSTTGNGIVGSANEVCARHRGLVLLPPANWCSGAGAP